MSEPPARSPGGRPKRLIAIWDRSGDQAACPAIPTGGITAIGQLAPVATLVMTTPALCGATSIPYGAETTSAPRAG
jgi:hypothetical protein